MLLHLENNTRVTLAWVLGMFAYDYKQSFGWNCIFSMQPMLILCAVSCNISGIKFWIIFLANVSCGRFRNLNDSVLNPQVSVVLSDV